jgi:hypothetical protein
VLRTLLARQRGVLGTAGALLLFAQTITPALAGTWSAPEGCEAFMTVQSKACRVSHYYTCEGDAAGDQWRVDMDQEGPFFFSRINAEGEWVESFDATRQVLDPSPVDRASFSELLANGIDTWDFTLSKDDGTGSRAAGYDRLTGKTVSSSFRGSRDIWRPSRSMTATR